MNALCPRCRKAPKHGTQSWCLACLRAYRAKWDAENMVGIASLAPTACHRSPVEVVEAARRVVLYQHRVEALVGAHGKRVHKSEEPFTIFGELEPSPQTDGREDPYAMRCPECWTALRAHGRGERGPQMRCPKCEAAKKRLERAG